MSATQPPTIGAAAADDVRSDALEMVIGDLLRWGVLLSVGVILAGVAVSFSHHPDYFVSTQALRRLTSPAQAPHSLDEVWSGLARVRGASIEMVGLLMLIALPVTRVAFAVVLFGLKRDRAFFVLSAVVLVLLALSFLLGRAE